MAPTAAVAGLALSAGIARRRAVSRAEERIFRRFNDGPDLIGVPLWVIMQSGSYGAVLVAAAIATERGQRRRALLVTTAGTGAWLGVKAVKPLIGRGRPDTLLASVRIRGRHQSGLGYPSGHAAVATTLALVATRPGRDRYAGVVMAGITSCARMYSGAHLPLDIVGGVALGRLVAGLVTKAAPRVLRP